MDVEFMAIFWKLVKKNVHFNELRNRFDNLRRTCCQVIYKRNRK